MACNAGAAQRTLQVKGCTFRVSLSKPSKENADFSREGFLRMKETWYDPHPFSLPPSIYAAPDAMCLFLTDVQLNKWRGNALPLPFELCRDEKQFTYDCYCYHSSTSYDSSLDTIYSSLSMGNCINRELILGNWLQCWTLRGLLELNEWVNTWFT